MNPLYRKLAVKMMITALLVALVPLNGLGIAIYLYYDRANQEQLQEEMRLRAANRAGAIAMFLAERTALLEVLAHGSRLAELTDPGRLEGIFQVMNRRSWSFLDLGVIDAKGDHRAYVGPYRLQEQNYAEADWFHQVMSRGVYTSDVFLGFRAVPHFVIAVKHAGGPEPWVLRATIDPEVFNRLVRSAQVGAAGDAYIVNREGLLQTPSRFDGGIMEKAGLAMGRVPPGNGVLERVDAKGRRLVTAYAWLPGDTWLLVIDEDPREMLGHLDTARSVEVVTLVAADLLILAAVLWLVRLLVGQLEKADRNRAALDAQLAHSARLVSLGRMAAGVAHEINNPLAAIGELAGEMEDLLTPQAAAAIPEGDVCRDNLRKIHNHVERAREVTHRMLKFARRMEPKQETLDVNEALRETHQFVAKEALFAGVEVNLELAPDLPLVCGDRAQLQQVFLNLLSNALDAVGEGGHVTLSSREAGDFLEVRVADDGPGIPPELADRIFDPFFTTKEPGQGTGLGLSISHSIMEKMGGGLTCQSRPGQGATFIVRIPNRRPLPA